MKRKIKHQKVFFYLLFAIFVLLALYVLSPIAKPIIAAIILAFVFSPLNEWLRKKTGTETIAALLTLLIVFTIILVPAGFLLNKAAEESTVAVIEVKQALFKLGQSDCGHNQTNCGLIGEVQEIISSPRYAFYISDSAEKVQEAVVAETSSFLVSLPRLFMSIIILLISLFYFLRDGDHIVDGIRKLTPLNKKNSERIFTRFITLSKSIVYGYVGAGIVQGIFALVGFWILNFIFSGAEPLITAPILWSVLLAILSLLPLIGAGFVWAPMSFYFIAIGLATETTNMFWGGVTLAIYGIVVISNVDNLARPLLAGKKAHVPPLIMYLGIFGGLFVFGFMGIFIGPIILALCMTLFSMYEENAV